MLTFRSLKLRLQAEKAVENKGYEGIIELCGVGLQQATNSHGYEKRQPMLNKVASSKASSKA